MTKQIQTDAEFRALTASDVQDLIEAEGREEDEYFSWSEWGIGEIRVFSGLSFVLAQHVAHSDEVSAIIVVTSPQDGYSWSVRYFEKQGCYDSYESVSRWDGDISEVRPHQETVTVWRKVNDR